MAKLSDKISCLGDTYEIINTGLINLGAAKETILLAEEISKHSLDILENESSIFDLFKEFKENCDSYFLNSVFIGYMSCVISQQYKG
jgi:hypothetical protein